MGISHPLFPYFFEKRLAIPTSPFFHLLVNGFSVTCKNNDFNRIAITIRNWKVIVQHITLANFYERIEIGVAGSPSMMLHFLPDVE